MSNLRRNIFGCLFSLCMVVWCALAHTDEVLLTQATFVLSDSHTPPPASAAWRDVSVPDRSSLEELAQERLGWYRFKLANTARTEPMGFYLWRFSMNAAVFFNGDYLGAAGPIDNRNIRATHKPLLFTLPESSWKSGDNFVHVNVRGVGGFARFMPPVYGPVRKLQPQFDERWLFQQEIPKLLTVVTILVGFLALSYSFADRTQRGYLWLAVACFAWLPFSLETYLIDAPISMEFWRWALHSGLDVNAAALALFSHRLTRTVAPKIEWGILLTIGLVITGYAAVPNNLFNPFMLAGHATANLVALYTFWVLVRGYLRSRSVSVLVFALGFVLMLPLSVHDLLFTALPMEEVWRQNFLALPYAAPALFLGLGIDMSWRAYRANAGLRRDVAEATAELEKSFVSRQKLESERATLMERDRVFRDIHDDVGSRLLSLVYSAKDEEQESLARSALEDIRSIVRLNTRDEPLNVVCAAWRAEISQRCTQAGYELRWQDTSSEIVLPAALHYHLTKVLRELVSNTLKHAQGTELSATISCEEGQLNITLTDNGSGFQLSSTEDGTGIRGIQQRIRSLGGRVAWSENEPGMRTVVHLSLV